MKYIIVSYATRGAYEKLSARLRNSLESLGIDHEIRIIDSLGTWQKNCLYKPEFIKEMLVKHQRPVVWVDADAVVNSIPTLFDSIEADFAVHIFKDIQLASGTLYFDNTINAGRLLDFWIKDNRMYPKDNDQNNLAKAIKSLSFKFPENIVFLPETYCWIYDLSTGPGVPVIEHFQASRNLMVEENTAGNQKSLYEGLWSNGYTQSACALPLAQWIFNDDQYNQSKILEIGCGNGKTAWTLFNHGYNYYGLDITLKGVRKVFQRYDESILKRFIEAPAWQMPFEDQAFDHTFSTDVLEHIPYHMLEQTIREIYRVTKKSTLHIIATFPDTRDGVELHPVVRPIEWWQEMFKKVNTKGITTEIIDRKHFLDMMTPK